jgi:hypothetical protein
LIRLKSLSEETGCNILAKGEWMQPGGNVWLAVSLLSRLKCCTFVMSTTRFNWIWWCNNRHFQGIDAAEWYKMFLECSHLLFLSTSTGSVKDRAAHYIIKVRFVKIREKKKTRNMERHTCSSPHAQPTGCRRERSA